MKSNDQITVSVDGNESVTLQEFIDINNAEGEDNIVTEVDIADIKEMPVGDFIFIGNSQVERTS